MTYTKDSNKAQRWYSYRHPRVSVNLSLANVLDDSQPDLVFIRVQLRPYKTNLFLTSHMGEWSKGVLITSHYQGHWTEWDVELPLPRTLYRALTVLITETQDAGGVRADKAARILWQGLRQKMQSWQSSTQRTSSRTQTKDGDDLRV